MDNIYIARLFHIIDKGEKHFGSEKVFEGELAEAGHNAHAAVKASEVTRVICQYPSVEQLNDVIKDHVTKALDRFEELTDQAIAQR